MKKKVLTIFAVLIAAFLAYTIFLAPAFGHDTLWNTEEALQYYLEHHHGHDREVTILKTAQKGRVKAAIYEWESEQYIALFEKTLFGLRWKYTGMNGVRNDGLLSSSGYWKRSGLKCVVEVYGDNRTGQVGSYEMEYHEQIARSDLEADFILDIYIMDGISGLPSRKLLNQYTPDGQLIER